MPTLLRLFADWNIRQESPRMSTNFAGQAGMLRSEAEIAGGFVTGVDPEGAFQSIERPTLIPSPKALAPFDLKGNQDVQKFDRNGDAAAILFRKDQLYRLPSIVTPRRDENGHATLEDADDVRNFPCNPVHRRYFFDEEKPLAFLRHFDVRISAKERPEKLLGGHVQDADPGTMRYYYCDFLYMPEFQPPFQKDDSWVELETMKEYIEAACPRTRLDVYPLYTLLKGVLRHLLDKETKIVSARERALQKHIQELLDEKQWLARRHSDERKLMNERLERLANQLAEAERNLKLDEEERAKLKSQMLDLEVAAAGAKQLAEEASRSKEDIELLARGLAISDRVKMLNILGSWM